MTAERAALDDVEAVLVTHEHFDHLDSERLVAAASANPALTVYTCPGVARHLAQLGDRVHIVTDGDVVSVAGVEIVAVGEKHHYSHPDAPPLDNVGFLIDGQLLHPGDALPVIEVSTLLPAGQAPWLTVPDLVSYLRAVAAQRAYAVHDGLLNDWGLQVLDRVLDMEAQRSGAEIRRLRPGETVEL